MRINETTKQLSTSEILYSVCGPETMCVCTEPLATNPPFTSMLSGKAWHFSLKGYYARQAPHTATGIAQTKSSSLEAGSETTRESQRFTFAVENEDLMQSVAIQIRNWPRSIYHIGTTLPWLVACCHIYPFWIFTGRGLKPQRCLACTRSAEAWVLPTPTCHKCNKEWRPALARGRKHR